ncbi:MAG: rhodanese-like domain-containing protein [Rhodospirillales bacterium]
MTSFFSRLFGGKPGEDTGWIDGEELARNLDRVLVVDVRGPGEFTGPLGHIEGARNIPLDIFATETEALLAHEGPIVLVCHTDRRSSAAAAHLRAAGATDIAVLRGGMVAWRG